MRVGRFERWIGAVLLGTAVAATACFGPPQATRQLRAYVSSEEAGVVAVVDPMAGTVLSRIEVGKRPRGLHLSPDGSILYAALSGSPIAGPGVDESQLPPPDRSADGIGVIDLRADKLLKVLPSGQDPETFDLSSDGRTLYISNEETAEMTVLNVESGAIIGRVPVGEEPEGVTLQPDGARVYVTSEATNSVAVVDTAARKVVASIKTGPRPRSIAFTPDGLLGFVTEENGNALSVFDGRTLAHVSRILLSDDMGAPARPMGLAMSPDGKTLFVSNGRHRSVAVIDVARRSVRRLIREVGERPWGIAISPDGRVVYTANGPSDDLSVIDVATGVVTKRIPIGGRPWGVVAGLEPDRSGGR